MYLEPSVRGTARPVRTARIALSSAMRSSALVYRFAQVTLRAFTPLLARGDSKFARGMRARRDAHDRLVRWGAESRDQARPVVWVHAPSVGEGLQARAVIEALRARRPDIQVVFTHFSPSAEALARQMPVDFADYLPWDLPSAMRSVLDAVRPAVVAFTKTEVWPVLVEEAGERDIPVAMIAGSLPDTSSRGRWPARALLRPTWARLSAVAAISEADAGGFSSLGVPAEVVAVMGDPGVDSAAQRAGGADPALPYLAPFLAEPRPTVIAGSTWPAGEDVLIPALAHVKELIPDVRVVVAPHEPTPDRVAELASRLAGAGFRVAPLSAIEELAGLGVTDAVIVDRVGPLAHLYTVGTVAYVGGGFHDAGLHSVLEPAAAGLPMAFGPRHHNAVAARDLLDGEGAKVASGPESLAQVLLGWLQDEERRDYTGARTRGYIDAHLGAADGTAALLERLLDERVDS